MNTDGAALLSRGLGQALAAAVARGELVAPGRPGTGTALDPPQGF